MSTQVTAELTSKRYEMGSPLTTIGGLLASGTDGVTGDLDGSATWEGIMAVDASGAGGYVSMSRFEGRLAGRSGSFLFTIAGVSHAGGTTTAAVTVVPGSGTGELADLSGSGTLRSAGNAATLDLAYSL